MGMALMATPFNATAGPKDNIQIDLPDFSARVKHNGEKALETLKAEADAGTQRALDRLAARLASYEKESRDAKSSYLASQTHPDAKAIDASLGL